MKRDDSVCELIIIVYSYLSRITALSVKEKVDSSALGTGTNAG